MNHRSPGSWAFSLMAAMLAFVSCAAPQPAASQALRSQVGAYELTVLVNGEVARTFQHAGETHILGQQGSRYVLRVHNHSSRRIEAVVSVDGLDVIDGKPGDFANKRGYLVPAYGYVDIDGWRLSNREAAAFRFAPIGESYAAKTGKARNVGVIGVAVFPERVVRRPPPVYLPRAEEEYEGASRDYDDYGARAESKAAPEAERPVPAASAANRSGDADKSSADEAVAGRSGSSERARRSRGGLGTEFGEAVRSEIQHVEFVRAQPSRPTTLLGARYNDRRGLYALGIDVDGWDQDRDLALRQSANPFPVSQRGYARPPTDWRRD